MQCIQTGAQLTSSTNWVEKMFTHLTLTISVECMISQHANESTSKASTKLPVSQIQTATNLKRTFRAENFTSMGLISCMNIRTLRQQFLTFHQILRFGSFDEIQLFACSPTFSSKRSDQWCLFWKRDEKGPKMAQIIPSLSPSDHCPFQFSSLPGYPTDAGSIGASLRQESAWDDGPAPQDASPLLPWLWRSRYSA